VVEPGQPALEEIRRVFGEAVLRRDGSLDRPALGAVVFSDSEARARLEAILHPRIRQLWKASAAEWRSRGTSRGFVVIPLLYETRAESEFDLVFCAACGAGTQRARLALRGWSEEEIEKRLASQMPAAHKMDRADGVIWNDSTLEICQDQCARLLRLARANLT
jgi:dephospho-CoA kinase